MNIRANHPLTTAWLTEVLWLPSLNASRKGVTALGNSLTGSVEHYAMRDSYLCVFRLEIFTSTIATLTSFNLV